MPHEGDAVQAGINKLAFAYNVPLIQAAPVLPEEWRKTLCESGLWLQSVKVSEDGKYLVLRLSEQDGRRALVRFPQGVYGMNMLEDANWETFDAMHVSPFEIITVGIPLKKEEMQA